MRHAILKRLKTLGYKGKNDDIEAIKSFLEEKDIDLQPIDGKTNEPVSLEKALSKKTVTISVSADAGEDVAVVDGNEQQSAEEDEEEEDEPEMASADSSEVEKTIARLRKDFARLNRLEGDPERRKAFLAASGVPSSGMFPQASTSRDRAARKAYEARARKGKTHFADADTAEAFGAWFRTTIAGPHSYGQKANDREILRKANVTTQNSLGGALVPEDFEATLIDLKEDRGVARRLGRVVTMSRDTLTFPRRTSGLTVYAPGEASSITESNPNFDNVSLIARKWATLTRISSELLNDAAVSIADQVAEEIAYAFADKEDECFFNGDGTSTFFGITGVRSALTDLSGTIANIAGLTVGSGNAYSELTEADFLGVIGNLPEFADNPSSRWVFSKTFWATVVVKLIRAAGGTTQAEGESAPSRNAWGYNVEVAQVMPRIEGNSQVCALLGDFSQAAMIGDVAGSMEIATSDQRYFESDEIAVRGTQRIAMNIHDVGNASATAASRQAGPVVGLITAAS